MPLNASFVRLLKNKVSSEQPKIIIHQKWGTNNLNACLCPKSNLAHRRKVKRRSRYRHPPPDFKGGGIQSALFGFQKKEKCIYSEKSEKGLSTKRGKPTSRIFDPKARRETIKPKKLPTFNIGSLFT